MTTPDCGSWGLFGLRGARFEDARARDYREQSSLIGTMSITYRRIRGRRVTDENTSDTIVLSHFSHASGPVWHCMVQSLGGTLICRFIEQLSMLWINKAGEVHVFKQPVLLDKRFKFFVTVLADAVIEQQR